MTESQSERIRGIERLWRSIQAQHGLNHALDLLLGGVSAPDYRFLDLARAVFMDWNPGQTPSQDNYPADLADRLEALNIFSVKNILDNQKQRLVLVDKLADEIENAA